MVLSIIFTIWAAFILLFTVIVWFVYISKILKPYYERFMTKVWYPYKKETCIKFIDKISSSDPELRIKKYKKIEKMNKELEYLASKFEVEEEEIKLTINREQAELTDIIMQHIDDMIEFQISNYLRETVSTNQKFDILKLDDGIKKISETVQSGLSQSLFNTPLLYTNDYIMNYIVNKTFTVLLKVIKEFNRQIELGV